MKYITKYITKQNKGDTKMKYIILIGFLFMSFFSHAAQSDLANQQGEAFEELIASSGGGQLQLPLGYKIYKAALTTVGPDGDVILFYKDGNEIVIKECEHHSVINNISDCKAKSWLNHPIRVAVSEFKNRLKSALRIQTFDTLGQQQAKKLKIYREGLTRKSSTEYDDLVLVQQRDEAQSKVSKIEAFIESYGEENANAEEVLILRRHLATLDSKVKDNKKFSDTVESLNASIDQLVDDVIGSSQMNTIRYSKDKTSIEYSVLRTYVRPYLAQTAFVPVKAGKHSIGDLKGKYPTTLTKGFEIGSTEVTQLQWVVVMGSNPSFFKKDSYCPESYMEIKGVSLCPDFPVESVSWNDVKEYISAYNERAKDNFTYRLPTETEWEFAARAGTNTQYSFFPTIKRGSELLPDYAWFSGNSENQTRAVATKKPNPLGIYDVHGNVLEWVEDVYGDIVYRPLIDPTGPTRVSDSELIRLKNTKGHVMRGGGWKYYMSYENSSTRSVFQGVNPISLLSSGVRGYGLPDYHWNDVGFRLVRVPNN